jgi:hypothetical protein
MWLSEANAAPHESSDSCQAILLTMPCTIALRLSASLPSLPFTVWPCRLPRYLPAADSLLALYRLLLLSSAHPYLLPAVAPERANATSQISATPCGPFMVRVSVPLRGQPSYTSRNTSRCLARLALLDSRRSAISF